MAFPAKCEPVEHYTWMQNAASKLACGNNVRVNYSTPQTNMLQGFSYVTRVIKPLLDLIAAPHHTTYQLYYHISNEELQGPYALDHRRIYTNAHTTKRISIFRVTNNKHQPIANIPIVDDYLENQAANQMLITNNQHIVRVFENEGNIKIYTNKITWEMVYVATVLHVSYFINPSNKPQIHLYTKKSLEQNPEVWELFRLLCISPESASQKLEDILNDPKRREMKYKVLNNAIYSPSSGELGRIEREIYDKETNMEQSMALLQSLAVQIEMLREQYEHTIELLNKDTDPKQEVYNYLAKHKYIQNIYPINANILNNFRNSHMGISNTTEGKMMLLINAPLANFDDFDMKTLVARHQKSQAIGNIVIRDLFDTLTNRIFLAQQYSFWISTALLFDTATYRMKDWTNSYRPDSFGGYNDQPIVYPPIDEALPFFPHPHITLVGCWGNHESAIKDWAKHKDLPGTFEQLCYIVRNLNFVDNPVVSKLFRYIKETMLLENNDIWTKTRGIEDTETGIFYTIPEMIYKIAKEKGCENVLCDNHPAYEHFRRLEEKNDEDDQIE